MLNMSVKCKRWRQQCWVSSYCRHWLVVGVHSVRHVSADHEGERRRLLEAGWVGGGEGEAAEDELRQVGLSSLGALWPHLQETSATQRHSKIKSQKIKIVLLRSFLSNNTSEICMVKRVFFHKLLSTTRSNTSGSERKWEPTGSLSFLASWHCYASVGTHLLVVVQSDHADVGIFGQRVSSAGLQQPLGERENTVRH